jgi:Protein of unknown function (DUF3105)
VFAGGIAAHWWLYTEHGLLAAFIDALYTPGVLLILLGVILVSGIVHEFGHASGLRYGGGHARTMGFGFYAVFPVFFTDATDSYRLGRWARVRTGLGGVYFHFIFSLALMGFALATGNEFLLIAVLLINLEIVHQFIPFLRLDGYWVLTDLTGVPDFFSQAGPFLRSLVPKGMAPGTKLPPLKRWAQVVFVAYLALTIPVLAFLLFLLVKRLPGILTVAWDAVATHVAIVRDAAGDGDVLTLATSLTQILILALPVVGIAYVLYTLTARPLKAAWRQPTVERRSAGVLAITAVIAAVGVPHAGRSAFRGEGQLADHDPVWQDCGFYSVPVRDENAVHSLEHGAIWITYRPGLARRQVEQLQSLARREDRVLVSPYPGLANPIVVSSWGHRMPVSTARDNRIDRFVRVFRDHSDAPEPGGSCSGGKSSGR